MLNCFSFALASAMMSSSVRLPTTGYRALRTISSGSASAAVASFTRIPFLPCTRRNSALISPSTFFSARTLILWTSWTSSSTSPSISSDLPHVAQRGQQRDPDRRRGRLEIRGIHLHRPGPPPRHDLLRHSLEQAAGQPDRLHPLQLADLGQQRLQLDRPRVLLQLLQEPLPAASRRALRILAVAISSSSLPTDSAGRRPRVVSVKLPLEHRLRRAQHPLDLARRRRLDPHLPAAGQQRAPQPVPRDLHRADVGRQPDGQPVLVVDRGLRELVEVPDLAPVV